MGQLLKPSDTWESCQRYVVIVLIFLGMEQPHGEHGFHLKSCFSSEICTQLGCASPSERRLRATSAVKFNTLVCPRYLWTFLTAKEISSSVLLHDGEKNINAGRESSSRKSEIFNLV